MREKKKQTVLVFFFYLKLQQMRKVQLVFIAECRSMDGSNKIGSRKRAIESLSRSHSKYILIRWGFHLRASVPFYRRLLELSMYPSLKSLYA